MRTKNVVHKINILPVRAQGVVYHIVKYMSVIIIIIIIVFPGQKLRITFCSYLHVRSSCDNPVQLTGP